MKLEKIDRLFAAYGKNAPASKTQNVEENQIKQATAQVEEAVKVARDFGTQAAGSSGGNNSEKVARIKEQVQNGTYKPDTREVAKALIKDLFV